MNESEIEEKLRAIKPVSPSRSLEGRIARDLAPASGTASSGVLASGKSSWLARILTPLGWAAAGAAAAVITMISLDRTDGKTPGQPASSGVTMSNAGTPADVEREMLDVSDEGILDDGTTGPSRVVRYTSLERQKWSEPGGAITLVEVPREDLVLVPVSFQ